MARLVLLLALLLLGSLPAHAGLYDGCGTNNTGALCDGEPSAESNARRVAETYRASDQQQSKNLGHNHVFSLCPSTRERGTPGPYGAGVAFWRLYVSWKNDTVGQTCGGSTMGTVFRDYLDSAACEVGYGVDPLNPTQCLTRAKCQAKPNLGRGVTTGGNENSCNQGCEFAPVGGGGTTFPDGTTYWFATSWKASGNACPAATPPNPPADKDQECKQIGTQTMCQKPTGEQCASARNGRQFCWKPGETGEKTDGPSMQKRNAGPTEIPPSNLQLASGDSLVKQGQSMTTTTTTSTSTSTTTTNYTTQNGTNAGSKNEGESASGDGSGKEEGEGDGKGASGGTNCETPPVVTGDQVLGMVATQAWQTRCAVEAGNAAKVTGDVGDCAQPYTVEGDNANAHQLRAMRASICGPDANGNKRPDWTETNGTETPVPGEGDEEPGLIGKLINTDALDAGGFLGGGSSCPAMGVVDLKFAQVDLSSASWWCPFVSMCRAILLLMGAFIAIRLLME